ncbi:hypothetical protein DENSPDRAFT_864994 [Dentipellis sp. KUC8613]|nr:hypothetical protein DENSPDRAFT_864994 [Dentipellis sp. KUC8613]
MSALRKETSKSASAAVDRASPPSPPLPVASLHADLLSLLTLLYSDTNKLSIALNPASPTYSAALTPAKDIAKRVGTLASNAASFDPQAHGRTLTKEVHQVVKDILSAIRELAQAHLNLTKDNAQKAKAGKGAAGEEYLVKTAAVHSLIQRAKSSGDDGLSKSNLQAVKKVWNEHGETIDDSVLEFKEMAEEGGEGEEEEDGWDEAGFDFGSIKINVPQRKLAETLEGLYKRTFELHEEVSKSLLSSPSRISLDAPQVTLDSLTEKASTLSYAADELASRVYCQPEDPSVMELHEVRDEFADALEDIAKAVDSLWNNEDKKDAKEKGSRTWFEKQYAELAKSIKSIEWSPEDTKT